MQIKILGSGCKKCLELYDNTKKAAEELSLEFTIEKVEDFDLINEYGVMITPALVLDEKVVASGKTITVEKIKDLIKKYS